MLKKYRWQLIITTVIILLPILAGLILWDKLPEQMPTHFNSDGVADGFSSKAFAVFGLPGILLAAHWICILATNADPKRKNIHGKALALIFWICPAVSVLGEFAIYSYAMGSKIDVSRIILIFVSLVFIIIGNYMPKFQQSYTMGIKLPWTLNDPENWNATHRMAGKLWVIGGIVMLLGAFTGSMVPFIVIAALLVLIPTIYSYVYYVRHK